MTTCTMSLLDNASTDADHQTLERVTENTINQDCMQVSILNENIDVTIIIINCTIITKAIIIIINHYST